MMNAPSDTRPVNQTDIEPLRHLLAAAFSEDPLLAFLQPNEKKRAGFGRWFFGSAVKYGRSNGVALTDVEVTGAAIWLPPGQTEMKSWPAFRSGYWQAPFRLGLRGLNRFKALGEATDEAHARNMPGAHWYLLMLGVSPDAQGTGVGTALIEAGKARAREAGTHCYLETMTESNVEFYKRRGFEVVDDFVIADEVRTWAMAWRPD